MLRQIVAALVVAALTLPAVAGTSPRTEVESYVVAAGLVTPAGLDCEDDTRNVNGACFTLDGNEESVHFTVEDVTGLPVAVGYSAFIGGLRVDSGVLCDGEGRIYLVPGTTKLVTFLGDLDAGCPTNKGTTGAITATFSYLY